MTIDYPAVLEVCKIVLKNHEGRNTATSSVKCGLITGITTLGACVLLGPLGIYAGAAIGSTVAYTAYRNEFKSLLRVIEEDFCDEERKELAEQVQQIMDEFKISDIPQLMMLLQGDVSMQTLMFDALKRCIKIYQENKELKVKRIY